MYIIKTMMQQSLTQMYKGAQPLMEVVADGRGFVHEMQIGDFHFERDEVSAAFGHPRMTTFDVVHYDENGKKLGIIGRQNIGGITEVHQMSYRPEGSTTWTIVNAQQIIDRVLQYRIEEEIALLDSLESALQLPAPASAPTLIGTEDVRVIPGECSLEEFLQNNGNQPYTVYYPDLSDGAHDKIIDVEFWEIDDEAPEPVKQGDARALLEQLNDRVLLLQDFNKQNAGVTKSNFIKNLFGTVSKLASDLGDKVTNIDDIRVAKAIEGAALFAALTLNATLSQPDMIIQLDHAVETDMASNQSNSKQDKQEQQCVVPAVDRLQVRLDMWRETDFYKTHVNGNSVERDQVEWIEDTAISTRDLWAKKESFFRKAGFESPDHMFMIAMRFGAIESYANTQPRNALNSKVLGPYHIAEKTFKDLIKKHPWLKDLPGFGGKTPHLNQRLDGYISTAVMLTLIVDDYQVASNILGQNPNSYLGKLYAYYQTQVDGSPLFASMARAVVEEPTKMQNHRRVLKTAADIAGHDVVRKNPSLFYRYAFVETNGKRKRIAIPLTPREHFEELQNRMMNDARVGQFMVLKKDVDARIAEMRATNPDLAPRCTPIPPAPMAKAA